MSSWSNNDKYHYGYSRIEVITGLMNAIFLIFVALSIGIFNVKIGTEALHRMEHPPEVSTDYLLLVAVMGFIVNLLGILFFQHDHVIL